VLRGTLPLRNMDEFHEAFGIEPGDDMYLPPEERIVIW
jgi:putative endopeptidase